MRKVLAALTAIAVPIIAAVGYSGAASAALPLSPHVIDLHSAFKQELAHQRAGKIGGVVYARDKQPSTAKTGPSCAEPACPLVWNGGPVQHAPRIYLLLWGPSWSTDSGQQASASYLESFYSGLGVQPQDSWSSTTSQYGDGAGFPTFSGSVFAGSWQDTSAPPFGATQEQLSAEADAFISSTVPGFNDSNDQVVVATQSGTCPAGFYASSCSGGSGDYCAWHSDSAGGASYTNLPYLLDSGAGCGANFVQNQYDGFSIVGGHEYAETVTDPDVDLGWWDPSDSSGGEVGDKCAWRDLGTVTLSSGTFAMQPLWSNAANDCALATSATDQVTVTSPGSQRAALGATVRLQIHGSSSQAKTITYSASQLPRGLSISKSTGLISGKATWPGNYAVTVTASDSTPATGSASFGWRINPAHGPVELLSHRAFCVDDSGGSLADNTKVDIRACAGTLAQNWAPFPNHSLRRYGGSGAIDTGACVNITDHSTSNGARVDLLGCDGQWNQLWAYSSATHQWKNPHSGKCLRDPGNSLTSGTQLELYACRASYVSEQWTNA
jgi:serine protease